MTDNALDNILLFSLRSIIDTPTAKVLYDLEGLDDASVYKAVNHLNKQRTGNDNLPIYLNSVVCISCCFIKDKQIDKFDLYVDDQINEEELLNKFVNALDEIDKVSLISWPLENSGTTLLKTRLFKYEIQANNFLFDTDLTVENVKSEIEAINFSHALQTQLSTGMADKQFPIEIMTQNDLWEAYLEGQHKEILSEAKHSLNALAMLYFKTSYMQGLCTKQEYRSYLEQLNH